MTITGQSSLSRDDIERMVRDAEAHAAEDRRRREEADARNDADTLVYQTEKLLAEQGAKLTGPERDQVDAGLAELKSALGGDDVAAIRAASERLTRASQAFAERLYREAADQHQAAAAGGSTSQDEEVVDAEVVDGGAR